MFENKIFANITCASNDLHRRNSRHHDGSELLRAVELAFTERHNTVAARTLLIAIRADTD